MGKNRKKEFELINSIKAGDTSEFKILVEKYKEVSFSLACSILKNEQDAEDALQESFIKAFSGLRKFNFKSSFSTWLYKIVVNTCKTKYSHQKISNRCVNFDAYQRIEIKENNTPLEKMEVKQRKEAVNRILDTIKPDESLLLRMFYLAELSIKEIKEITNFNESKIKVTLWRARKSFYLQLQKRYGPEITQLT
ncbi:MAG: sigma-70 family RNA polymerase sigma factor [Flavobacteriaceae bacterium]|jgi:RNA polymerase sigma factor (sigma-70 family)